MSADYVATIHRDPWTGELLVSAYDARAWLKAMGATWRPREKAWQMPPFQLERIIEELEAVYGYTVVLVGVERAKRQALGEFRRPHGSWAEEMFAAVPEHLHEPIFRALMRVLHPDVGGDGRAAQQLNDARPTEMRRMA